jgi:glycosyltransferase involved in cell wall biosynthesis
MRIAFITGEYPPLQGGLGDYTRELARALADTAAAMKHEVHVLSRQVPAPPLFEVSDGIHVHRLVPGWGWGSIGQVSRFVRDYQLDVLHLQYQAAAYAMHPAINLLPRLLAGRRAPLVVTFHDLKVPYLFPKAGRLRWQAVLDMARKAAAAVVTNREDADALEHAGLNSVLIPIGSNITPPSPEQRQTFDRAGWRRAHGLPIDGPLIGYFGFLNESKGGETLVRALAELHHTERPITAHLLLIGGTAGASDPTNVGYAARIMQLAESLHVRKWIVPTGFLDAHEVSAALAACDCLALPYQDGASFRRGTLMAALAHGCAVVTTAPRINLPELHDGVNMLLVPPGDTPRLADALERVLSDATLRLRLQAGSLQLGASFAWPAIAMQTVSLYQRLITDR